MEHKSIDEQSELIETIRRELLSINTGIPGIIESFNPENQTCTVIPAIKMRVLIDGVISYVDYPPIINCPVMLIYGPGAGFGITFPIQPGDSCYIHFAQRSIDNWHDKGGIQPPENGFVSRNHDLTDAVVFVCAPSMPEKITDYRIDGIEVRDATGNIRVTVKADKVEIGANTSKITVNLDGSVVIDAPGDVTVNGNISATGDVADATGTMQAIRDTYNSHTHISNGYGVATDTPVPTM